MIRCNLSTIMGARKLKIADVARKTGLNRSTVTRLYYESAERVELDAVDRLCAALDCDVGDLFDYIPDGEGGQPIS